MENELFCTECETVRAVVWSMIDQTFRVRGEEVLVRGNVARCNACGHHVSHMEEDDATLKSAYNEYRKRKGLLLPEEIQQIREKYRLSQRAFARLMDCGEVTIHRYERGALQTEAHDGFIRLLQDPDNVRRLIREHRSGLSSAELERLERTLTEMESEWRNNLPSVSIPLPDEVGDWMTGGPTVFTGFRTFNFNRFAAMALFMSEHCQGVYKTKLWKLLWYADFLWFKRQGRSISGTVYAHLPYGPVPDQHGLLLVKLIREGILEEHWDGIADKPLYRAATRGSIRFNDKEIDFLRFIGDRLGGLSAAELSDRSHREVGYLQTDNGQWISYQYAESLSLD